MREYEIIFNMQLKPEKVGKECKTKKKQSTSALKRKQLKIHLILNKIYQLSH